jgi:hypothetical protein
VENNANPRRNRSKRIMLVRIANASVASTLRPRNHRRHPRTRIDHRSRHFFRERSRPSTPSNPEAKPMPSAEHASMDGRPVAAWASRGASDRRTAPAHRLARAATPTATSTARSAARRGPLPTNLIPFPKLTAAPA